MGIELKAQLTIYFELDPAIRIPTFKPGARCSDSGCRNHNNPMENAKAKFCESCGSPTTACKIHTGFTSPNIIDFCEEVFGERDYLVEDHERIDCSVWKYNREHGPTKDLNKMMQGQGGAMDLSSLDPKAIMAEAIEKDPQLARVIPEFKKYFNISVYDEDAIGMKYGIITYYA